MASDQKQQTPHCEQCGINCQDCELDRLRAENERLHTALQRIADMPLSPRPDGTFNYGRAALIQIAGMALGRGI